ASLAALGVAAFLLVASAGDAFLAEHKAQAARPALVTTVPLRSATAVASGAAAATAAVRTPAPQTGDLLKAAASVALLCAAASSLGRRTAAPKKSVRCTALVSLHSPAPMTKPVVAVKEALPAVESVMLFDLEAVSKIITATPAAVPVVVAAVRQSASPAPAPEAVRSPSLST
ncbi:unnamed protein product, partial [Polarella glacialis]